MCRFPFRAILTRVCGNSVRCIASNALSFYFGTTSLELDLHPKLGLRIPRLRTNHNPNHPVVVGFVLNLHQGREEPLSGRVTQVEPSLRH